MKNTITKQTNHFIETITIAVPEIYPQTPFYLDLFYILDPHPQCGSGRSLIMRTGTLV